MYRAILFDLDNTLLLPVNSLTSRLLSLYVNGVALFSEQSAREAQRKAELWTANQILHEIETSTRMDDNLFLENVLRCYRECAAIHCEKSERLIYQVVTDRAKSAPTSEVYCLLNKLKSKYILGIVSNNSSRVREVLKEFDLVSYFQVVTISAEVGIEKPNPEIMYRTCNDIQVKPEECLYVGDHPFDILCAEKAGMDCAWVDHGVFYKDDLPAEPRFIIYSLRELLHVC